MIAEAIPSSSRVTVAFILQDSVGLLDFPPQTIRRHMGRSTARVRLGLLVSLQRSVPSHSAQTNTFEAVIMVLNDLNTDPVGYSVARCTCLLMQTDCFLQTANDVAATEYAQHTVSRGSLTAWLRFLI